MKKDLLYRDLFLSAISFILLLGCATTNSLGTYSGDDLYYVPSHGYSNISATSSSKQTSAKPTNEQLVQEARREYLSTKTDGRDMSYLAKQNTPTATNAQTTSSDALLQAATNELRNSASSSTTSTSYQSNDEGWLNDFIGTDRDFQEAQLIINRYPQGFAAFGNNYEIANYLANDSDWNVYTRNGYYWWFPTKYNTDFYSQYLFGTYPKSAYIVVWNNPRFTCTDFDRMFNSCYFANTFGTNSFRFGLSFSNCGWCGYTGWGDPYCYDSWYWNRPYCGYPYYCNPCYRPYPPYYRPCPPYYGHGGKPGYPNWGPGNYPSLPSTPRPSQRPGYYSSLRPNPSKPSNGYSPIDRGTNTPTQVAPSGSNRFDGYSTRPTDRRKSTTFQHNNQQSTGNTVKQEYPSRSNVNTINNSTRNQNSTRPATNSSYRRPSTTTRGTTTRPSSTRSTSSTTRPTTNRSSYPTRSTSSSYSRPTYSSPSYSPAPSRSTTTQRSTTSRTRR